MIRVLVTYDDPVGMERSEACEATLRLVKSQLDSPGIAPRPVSVELTDDKVSGSV